MTRTVKAALYFLSAYLIFLLLLLAVRLVQMLR